MTEEQWVKMRDAANILGIPANRVSRWAGKGLIEVKTHPFDKRLRLVNLVEVQTRLAELNAIENRGNPDKENGKLDT